MFNYQALQEFATDLFKEFPKQLPSFSFEWDSYLPNFTIYFDWEKGKVIDSILLGWIDASQLEIRPKPGQIAILVADSGNPDAKFWFHVPIFPKNS